MNIVHNVSHVNEIAYQIARLINLGRYQDVVVYEFHNPVDVDKIINCESGHELFVSKSHKYYDAILSIDPDPVDVFPASIDIIVKFNKEWLLAYDAGSNYYLGYGPVGIIQLRKACYDNGVLIIHSTKSTQVWIESVAKHDDNLLSVTDIYEFNIIIKQLIKFADNIQELRTTFQKLNEENLRDIIITSLRAYIDNVNGEAISGNGKTDIHIRSRKGSYPYIFELKIWKGESSLKPTIEQLIGYLTWEHDYAGVVVFCKNVDFGSVLKKSKEYLASLYQIVALDETRKREIKVKVPYPNDNEKEVTVHIIFVDLG